MLIAVSIFCKISVGEYYLGGFYDPAYAYLMNSLNLSQLSGYGVGHFDHPGTTVQTAGAIVIKIFYLFGNTGNDIATDVISRPEYYLSRINFTFIIVTGAALYILGIAAYRKFNNIYAALILQLTPFFPPTVYDHFADVSSESLFIVAIILFLAAVISYTDFKETDSKSRIKNSLILGLVCGFGLAGKIIFLPLVIIPLMLIRQFKFKLLFLFFTVLFFLMFVYPALTMENAAKYVNWISGIATHSGKYGSGQESVIDSSTYFVNLKNIFFNDLSFSFTYTVILFTLAAGLILKIQKRFKNNFYFTLSAGIFCAMTIQIILVAKHFDPRYMITVNMLSVTGLTAVCFIAADYYTGAVSKKINFFITAAIIFFSSYRLILMYSSYSEYSHSRDESRKINSFVEDNFKDLPLVYSNLINNQVYSLYFGTDWAGSQQKRYISIIQNLHKEYYYFDRYAGDFILTDLTSLNKMVSSSDKILFQSDTDEMRDRFMVKLKSLTKNDQLVSKEIYSNDNGEKLYEIRLKP
jgi:hypothetical protein